MKCMLHECSATATQQLGYVMMATSGENRGRMGLQVCDVHATKALADSMFNQGPVRQQIEAGMVNAELGKPDWTRSYAEWVELFNPQRDTL